VDLQLLEKLFTDHGVKRLFAKELAANDNSKNQPYFGCDFEVLSLFPMRHLSASSVGIKKNIKAELDFSWVLPTGELVSAPHAKLILYPQYPEVRFSGFLLGCRSSSAHWDSMKLLLNRRSNGRILFLGVTETNQIIGFVTAGDSELAAEFHAQIPISTCGVFVELLISQSSNPALSRSILLAELSRIHRLGWILSKKLNSAGVFSLCNYSQCGGLTLEAELGIRMNSSIDPDFMGWEIKQHSVSDFSKPPTSKAITMMTPEPTGGYYRDHGPEAFVRKFGYKDRNGVPDRLNFGGIFRTSKRHPLTGLTLQLSGYDLTASKVTDPNGEIQLVNDQGDVAASWGFVGIVAHWAKKHSKAAFVPSKIQRITRTPSGEDRQYLYGNTVRLAEHSDSIKVIHAIAKGDLYYDPALKIVNQSQAKPEMKCRSQWRVASKKIGSLYQTVTFVSV
jgi:hypothetical protein